MMSASNAKYSPHLPVTEQGVEDRSKEDNEEPRSRLLVNRQNAVFSTKLIIALQIFLFLITTVWQLPIALIGIPLAVLVFGTAIHAMMTESAGYLLPIYTYLACQVVFSLLSIIALIAIAVLDPSALMFFFGRGGDLSLAAVLANVIMAITGAGLMAVLCSCQMTIVAKCRRQFLRKSEFLLFMHDVPSPCPTTPTFHHYQAAGQTKPKLPEETHQFTF